MIFALHAADLARNLAQEVGLRLLAAMGALMCHMLKKKTVNALLAVTMANRAAMAACRHLDVIGDRAMDGLGATVAGLRTRHMTICLFPLQNGAKTRHAEVCAARMVRHLATTSVLFRVTLITGMAVGEVLIQPRKKMVNVLSAARGVMSLARETLVCWAVMAALTIHQVSLKTVFALIAANLLALPVARATSLQVPKDI